MRSSISRRVYVNGLPLEEDYINGPTYGAYGPAVVLSRQLFCFWEITGTTATTVVSPMLAFVPARTSLAGPCFIYFARHNGKLRLIRQPAIGRRNRTEDQAGNGPLPSETNNEFLVWEDLGLIAAASRQSISIKQSLDSA